MKQHETFFQDVVKRLYTNPCRIFGIPPISDHETYIEVDEVYIQGCHQNETKNKDSKETQ